MNRNPLISSVEDILAQGSALLYTVDATIYSRIASAPYSASIGQHYRHVLDHFLCLADGLHTGVIDYDRRGRSRKLETDLVSAGNATSEVLQRLINLDAVTLDTPYTVLYSVGYSN